MCSYYFGRIPYKLRNAFCSYSCKGFGQFLPSCEILESPKCDKMLYFSEVAFQKSKNPMLFFGENHKVICAKVIPQWDRNKSRYKS